jgi:hypothetical protein
VHAHSQTRLRSPKKVSALEKCHCSLAGYSREHVLEPSEQQVEFTYISSTPKPDFHRLETRFVVQTGKALTLRDVVAETWLIVAWFGGRATVKVYDQDGQSGQDEQCHPDPKPEQQDDEDQVLEPTSLADIIRQLELPAWKLSTNAKSHFFLRTASSSLTGIVIDISDLSLWFPRTSKNMLRSPTTETPTLF